MSEKASTYVLESLNDSPEQPTSSQVLDAFADKRAELLACLDEVESRPGFKLNANELIAKRNDERATRDEINRFEAAYAELGGVYIDAAQAAIDALNFKSDANERVTAQSALTAARTQFYENFIASRAPESSKEVADDEAAFDVDYEVEAAKGRLNDRADQLEQRAVALINDNEQARIDRKLLDKVQEKSESEVESYGTYVTRHRTEVQDEDSPIFEELAREQSGDNTGANDGESQEEYEARQPGHHRAETGADDLKLFGQSSGADDLKLFGNKELSVDEYDMTKKRGRLRRLRDIFTSSGAVAEISAYRATRNEKERRRDKIVAGLGAAALLIGGGLLLLKGHNIFDSGGNDGTDPSTPDNSSATPESDPGAPLPQTPEAGRGMPTTVEVQPGDGEIRVTQRILEQNGIHVSAEDAQRIGEHAGVDLLVGDSNYDDTASTLNRIGGSAGEYQIRAGSAEALARAAHELGY